MVMGRITRSDLPLILIFVAMASAIVAKSYFDPDGYITRDGSNYLRLAQQLLMGNGYFNPVYDATGQAGSDDVFFAIWPVGYPTVIWGVAFLSGLSVFWASKLFNIILVLIVLGLLRANFKNAWVYGLVLFFSENIEVFSSSSSEGMFIVALLVLTHCLYLFMCKERLCFWLLGVIGLSSILLFLSRYVGAFSFGVIGLFGLYLTFVKRDLAKGSWLLVISVINIGLMCVYLYYNYLQTGYPTGVERISAPESMAELGAMYVKAIIGETVVLTSNVSNKVLVLAAAQFSLLLLVFLRWKGVLYASLEKRGTVSFVFAKTFVFVALVYLSILLLLRSLSHFDNISYRFLAPASFLLFLALIYSVQHGVVGSVKRYCLVVLCILSLASFMLSVPFDVLRKSRGGGGYNATVSELRNKYSEVEKDAIVVFGSIHLNYLYPGILNRRPYKLPYSASKESWEEFEARLLQGVESKSIYLSVPSTPPSAELVDESVINVLNRYEKGTLIKLML